MSFNLHVKIQGITPLLMNKFTDHGDDKTKDKNLTPRQEAEKVAHKLDNGQLYWPSMNLFSCIINAGKYHKLNKNKVTTMKSSLVPAGISITDELLMFETDHFEVDSRAVVIPATGGRIMKHRPRLDQWELTFQLTIDDNLFSERFVRTLIDDAGSKVGLGDYRPDRKGYFGRFKVIEWKKL